MLSGVGINLPKTYTKKNFLNTYKKPNSYQGPDYSAFGINFASTKSVIENFKKILPTQKQNLENLKKMFADANVSNTIMAGHYCTELLVELSKLDFKTVQEKYNYVNNAVKQRKNGFPPLSVKNILLSENITMPALVSLHNLALKQDSKTSIDVVHKIEAMIKDINNYSSFDKMPTKKQREFIIGLENHFNIQSAYSIKDDDILLQFDLIKDIKESGIVGLQQKLYEKAKNAPVYPVFVDENLAKDFVEGDIFSYENLLNTIGKINLSKYKEGVPLEYEREDFIEDFENLLLPLNEDNKQKVFDYFKFSIDESRDIINYPILNTDDISDYPKEVQKVIEKARRLIDNFMLKNRIVLNNEDKKTENTLNEFIKVFPEFISVIGKIQHRNDSIDHHTLEDLQLCLINPDTKKLSKEEQRILFLAVMFHDIAKKQAVIHKGHQRASAYWAKELLKKLPISFDEKERIFSVILNSHWVTDYKNPNDLASELRYNNDFKIAQILAKADTFSSGFEYDRAVSQLRIKEVDDCINKINSTGIPLFANNLPSDKSKFPTDSNGIKYLDFTDENSDLSKFGFKKDTKVSNLSFLCHNSPNNISEFSDLCDDSKDVCLSSEYRKAKDKGLLTSFNSDNKNNCHVIIHASNPNIALGGKNVLCTGNKRGVKEFKSYLYAENSANPKEQNNRKFRKEISNYLKFKLGLDDKEYSKFFSEINKFNSLDEIEDIILSSEKQLKSDDIKAAIEKLQENMLQDDNNRQYINEFVVFRPKIEALVMEKREFFNTELNNSEIKKTAKEKNIPIILV